MTISGFDTIAYTLAFLVPGFIFSQVLSGFAEKREEPQHILFLRYLTLSAINLAIWSWLIYLMSESEFYARNIGVTIITWSGVIFVSPVVFAILIGYFSQVETIQAILRRGGFIPVRVVARAWDYRFSNVEEPVWALVTLIDGSMVAGLFGYESFASLVSEENGIYLQEVYEIDDGGKWYPVPRSDGIIIRGDQIRTVEFWHLEEDLPAD